MERKRSTIFKIRRFFFTHRSFDRSFYRTVVYCLLIYARLTICMENLLLLHPLIARLSTETAGVFCFSASSSPAYLFLDAFRRLPASRRCHFTVVSLSSFVVSCHGLSFADFCFSHCSLAIQSFTSPSCRRGWLVSRFVVPSSASHSFTSACCRHRWPATRLLQLLIAIVNSSSS